MILYILFLIFIIIYLVRSILESFSIRNIEKKSVFITGCDTGFGRLLVNRLLKKGVTVFAGCYTRNGEIEVNEENIDYSENLFTLPIDVSDDDSVLEAYNFVVRTLETRTQILWAVVNNAGIFSAYGPDDWLTTKEYKQSLNVNFLGSVRMCHQFIPLLKQSRGRIVTMASVSGRIHSLYTAPYTAAKFALEGYMDCLRLEIRQYGVSVHIIEPGAFRTTLLDEKAFNERAETVWNHLPPGVRTEYGSFYLDNLKEAWNNGAELAASRNLHYVTNSYVHALFSAFPRCRYICGWDARFLWQPMSLLPALVQDYLLYFLYGLQPGPSLVPQALQRRTPTRSVASTSRKTSARS
uniref:D-beta-hydroxybutyrate dehydrogenase, mitochondrial n=1 Tax=Syphacia muris TaxID=451379 RepID=A0A0N5AHI0_9BILA